MMIEPVRGWATESEFEAYGEVGILVCDEAFGEADEIPVCLFPLTKEEAGKDLAIAIHEVRNGYPQREPIRFGVIKVTEEKK